MQEENVKLKDGTIVTGDAFNETDKEELLRIKEEVDNINKKVKSLGGRMINIPEVVSEGLFAYLFNAVRTNGKTGAKSYDCVMRETGEGIQVKAAQIEEDLTSFGPDSEWDRLFFMDFHKGSSVDIYEIPSDAIYNKVLNKSKNETFKEQQEQGRRPRLSLKKDIIQTLNITPIRTFKLK